jgi:MoaA/NifB/PqqE/SkfB family radical SAM enzyme
MLGGTPHLRLQVTLDGMLQEDLAPVQPIPIARVLERVAQAARALPSITLNYTLYRHNAASLARLVSFAAETGIRTIYVTPVKVYDVCKEAMAGLDVDLEDPRIVRDFADAAERAQILGIDLLLPTSQAQIPKLNPVSCASSHRFNPIIRADGQVLLCWGREDLTIGKIPVNSLESILDSPWRQRWLDDPATCRDSEVCASCSLLHPPDDGVYIACGASPRPYQPHMHVAGQ